MLIGGGSQRYLKLVQKFFFDVAEDIIKQNILDKAP